MLPLRNVKIQTSTRIHSRDEENRDISIPDEKSCTFINLFYLIFNTSTFFSFQCKCNLKCACLNILASKLMFLAFPSLCNCFDNWFYSINHNDDCNWNFIIKPSFSVFQPSFGLFGPKRPWKQTCSIVEQRQNNFINKHHETNFKQ